MLATRRFVSLIAFGAALIFAGCRDNYKMPPPPPLPLPVTNPGIRIILLVSPQPVRQMDPSWLTVHLINAHGEPVTDAAIRADLAMPGMDMGPNSVTLTQKAKGTYSGTVRIPMDGDWRVTVTATKGHEKSTRTYPLAVQ